MKVFVLLALVGFAAALPTQKLGFRNLYRDPVGTPSKSLRIIGGEEAVPNSIPYQAFLEASDGFGGWYCGGSLISADWVLTAGHCGDGAVDVKITLGAHRPLQSEPTQVVVTSTDITVHPDFDISIIANDVAVLGLSSPVELGGAVQAVALASGGNDYAGEVGTVSGWGLTDGFGSELSEVLMTLDVPIIPNSECAAIFDIVQDSNVCTSGDNGTGSCNGDSGGPLTVGGTQVGVVSFGVRNCLSGYPSAFARVSSFRDWITQTTGV